MEVCDTIKGALFGEGAEAESDTAAEGVDHERVLLAYLRSQAAGQRRRDDLGAI